MKEEQEITRAKAIEIIDDLTAEGCYSAAIEMVCKHRIGGLTATRDTIKKKFGINKLQLQLLHSYDVPNPYYEDAPPMRLYLLAEAEIKFGRKGKVEPLF